MKNQKTKIIITGPSLQRRGGVTFHAKTLLKSPLSESFQLAYFRVGPEYSDNKMTATLKLLATPFRFLFKLIIFRPDVAHFNPSFDRKSLLRELPLLLLCRIFGCAGMVQFHGGTLHNLVQKNRLPFYLKFMFKWANHVVLLTEIQKKLLLKFVAETKISVLPNMVDCSFELSSKTKKNGKITALFLSRLEKEKGVYDILESIPAVIEKFPQACFLFAGEGKDREKMEIICSESQFCDHVKFLGYIHEEEKSRFLSRGDVFLFPSQHPEGMPYALLEAMSHGLPIIATPVGAIPEIITNQENGFFVPTESPEILAETMIRLLSDFDLRKKMGQQNRQKVETFFNINVVCEKFKILYEKLSGK